MRLILALALLSGLASCISLTSATPFRAVDDLHTTHPRSLAEGGHGRKIQNPPGVSWLLALNGVEETPRRGVPSRHYELRVTLVDELPGAASDRLVLLLDGAALVDDEGRSFAATQLIPIEPGSRFREGAPPPPREYVVRFSVPASYRFARVARATVHWGLQVNLKDVLRISSRFSL